MKITVPISAVVTASLLSCSLCEAGGGNGYISAFKRSGVAFPLALGSSVFLSAVLFYFLRSFLHKKNGLNETARNKELDTEKKSVLLPSSEKYPDPNLNVKGNESDLKNLDESPSLKNFEENGKGGGAQKISKRRSFMLKLSFLGLIFIVLLITVLYFTCSKGEEDIENEEENYVLSKENIEDIWKTKYLGKIKEQKDLYSLAENLLTVLFFIKSIFLDFFEVNLSKEQTKSIYLEAFSSLKDICLSKSYKLEFSIKKKEVVWYFSFCFLVSENDVKVYCGMKNVQSTVEWFNEISAGCRVKTLNTEVGDYTILYAYSEMREQVLEKLKKFLKDKNPAYFLYEGEES